MPFLPREYQSNLVTGLARKIASAIRKLIAQLATGGGKTVVFSMICDSFLKKNPTLSVLILVHRVELLNQARETLYNTYGITAQKIVAGMRYIPPAKVYVGMVESVNTRIDKIKNIGLVIIDEAHRSDFNKMHAHFQAPIIIIGFTATPLSSNKKNPMKNHYEDIVCGIDIPELIDLNEKNPGQGLCQNITYCPKDIVSRAELATAKGGIIGNDFNEGLMSLAFSKPKYIYNTVAAYEKYAPHTKAIVFNCSIDHSMNVTKAFIGAGYQCKHLDGTTPTNIRRQILNWYHTTPGAILCNCDIATTGFDEKTIETIIVNRSTMSLPLWLQMCGRGSRPIGEKNMFTIIDMGGNAMVHGDWCDSRDWVAMFHNPPKPGTPKDSPAPVKTCPQCEALLQIQRGQCDFCGYVFPTKEDIAEGDLVNFVVITKNIDVNEIVSRSIGAKRQAAFYAISKMLADAAAQSVQDMNEARATVILNEFIKKLNEIPGYDKGKKYSRAEAKETLYNDLERHFKRWQADDPGANVSGNVAPAASLPAEARRPIPRRVQPLPPPAINGATETAPILYEVEFPDFDQFNSIFKL